MIKSKLNFKSAFIVIMFLIAAIVGVLFFNNSPKTTVKVDAVQAESVGYMHKYWARKMDIGTLRTYATQYFTKITFTNDESLIPAGKTGISIGSKISSGVCGDEEYDGNSNDVLGYIDGTEIVIYSVGKIYAPTNSKDLFMGYSNVTELNFNGIFDTSYVTDMQYMFYYSRNLTSIDVSNFDTSKVTNMQAMFRMCEKLTTIDVSNFNTANVENMKEMFAHNPSLVSVNLTGLNTAKVTDMRMMFEDCKLLTSVDLSSFETSKLVEMSNMFRNCESLTKIDLRTFDLASLTQINGTTCTLYGTNIKQLYAPYNLQGSAFLNMPSMFSASSNWYEAVEGAKYGTVLTDAVDSINVDTDSNSRTDTKYYTIGYLINADIKEATIVSGELPVIYYYTENDITIPLPRIAKDGYVFAGWSTNVAGYNVTEQNGAYTLTIPASNLRNFNLTAMFNAATEGQGYTVTVSHIQNGKVVDVEENNTVLDLYELELEQGKKISAVKINGVEVEVTDKIQLQNLTQDTQIDIIYASEAQPVNVLAIVLISLAVVAAVVVTVILIKKRSEY